MIPILYFFTGFEAIGRHLPDFVGFVKAYFAQTHTRRQLAFVRYTNGSAPTANLSSFKRRLRYSHDAKPASLEQHFGSVWSAQTKMCRWYFPIPNAFAASWSSAISSFIRMSR